MLKIESYKKAKQGSPNLYLVKNAHGRVVGMLEKYNNTRAELHPFKAFHASNGDEVCNNYLGAFYPELGGRKAAIAAIYHAEYNSEI